MTLLSKVCALIERESLIDAGTDLKSFRGNFDTHMGLNAARVAAIIVLCRTKAGQNPRETETFSRMQDEFARCLKDAPEDLMAKEFANVEERLDRAERALRLLMDGDLVAALAAAAGEKR